MSNPHVLIIDDEEGIRFGIRDYLDHKGYKVSDAATASLGLSSFMNERPDAVILDYQLPDGTALDLLPRLRAVDEGVPVIVLTAHGSIDLAVRAIKEGAEQFLTKPVELPALEVVLARVLENRRNRQRQQARRSSQARRAVNPFVGSSRHIQELEALARRVVQSDSPVLITGETGSGKGVLARWLHEQGPRVDEPFVDLNCAGLSQELLDSELFGHERGAFTGAVSQKAGLLEVANDGTLFLDEIGDMDLTVQAKLLKVLEEQRFRRLGEVRDRSVDVRLIAATHHELAALVRSGGFRRDLYYRINTIHLTVPALRDRAEDLPQLVDDLLRRLAADVGRGSVSLTDEAMDALRTYAWPGNVRELRNVLERAILLGDGGPLRRGDLRFEADGGSAPSYVGGPMTLREVEIAHIRAALQAERGKVQATAERLDIPKSSLYQKLKAYGIDASEFRT